MTAEQTGIYEGEWDIEDLRHVVEAQLEELRVLADNLEDINAKGTILDLSYKLENSLYCKCYYCVDPLKDPFDFARDIARVATVIHARDVATIGERIAKLIRDYAYENEEPWESDE